jgi:hypothetical protein
VRDDSTDRDNRADSSDRDNRYNRYNRADRDNRDNHANGSDRANHADRTIYLAFLSAKMVSYDGISIKHRLLPFTNIVITYLLDDCSIGGKGESDGNASSMCARQVGILCIFTVDVPLHLECYFVIHTGSIVVTKSTINKTKIA